MQIAFAATLINRRFILFNSLNSLLQSYDLQTVQL